MVTNMKPLRYSLLACFLAGALLITGCDSNDDDGDGGGGGGGGNLGTASVQITGEGIDEEFDGVSFFFSGEDPETGEQGTVIWMSPSQSQQTSQAVWFYMSNDRPGEGTFTLVDLTDGDSETELESSFGATALFDNLSVLSSGGTLRITTSSSTRVAGNFDFVGTAFSVANPEGVEVTVEGSFSAVTSGSVVFPF